MTVRVTTCLTLTVLVGEAAASAVTGVRAVAQTGKFRDSTADLPSMAERGSLNDAADVGKEDSGLPSEMLVINSGIFEGEGGMMMLGRGIKPLGRRMTVGGFVGVVIGAEVLMSRIVEAVLIEDMGVGSCLVDGVEREAVGVV